MVVQNGGQVRGVVGALVEGGVDHPEVRFVEVVEQRHSGVELSHEIGSLGIGGDRPDRHPDHRRPVGISVINRCQPAGDLFDPPTHRVIPLRSGNRQPVEQKEAQMSLDDQPRVPIQRHGTQDSEEVGLISRITHCKEQVGRLVGYDDLARHQARDDRSLVGPVSDVAKRDSWPKARERARVFCPLAWELAEGRAGELVLLQALALQLSEDDGRVSPAVANSGIRFPEIE